MKGKCIGEGERDMDWKEGRTYGLERRKRKELERRKEIGIGRNEDKKD
jgi:hypothetical protein